MEASEKKASEGKTFQEVMAAGLRSVYIKAIDQYEESVRLADEEMPDDEKPRC